MLNSVEAVIEALGGPTKTAAVAGVGASAVINWRTRGEISPENFLLITEAVRAAGKGEIDAMVFGFKARAPDEARA